MVVDANSDLDECSISYFDLGLSIKNNTFAFNFSENDWRSLIDDIWTISNETIARWRQLNH